MYWGVGVYICLSSPFLINIPLEALFFFFPQLPCHIQLQLCLSFPDPIPIPPNTIPVASPMDSSARAFLSRTLSQTRREDSASLVSCLLCLISYMWESRAFVVQGKDARRAASSLLPCSFIPKGRFQEFSSNSSSNKWQSALLEFSLYSSGPYPSNSNTQNIIYFHCSAPYAYSTSLLLWWKVGTMRKYFWWRNYLAPRAHQECGYGSVGRGGDANCEAKCRVLVLVLGEGSLCLAGVMSSCRAKNYTDLH